MSDIQKPAVPVSHIPNVPVPVGVNEKELQMIAMAISSVAQPLASAQQTAAIEATKQTQIIARSTQTTYIGFFVIGIGVLVLAGIALFKDKDQITSQLILAMFSFLGGLGIGRGSKK